jgi:hypothetical protein
MTIPTEIHARLSTSERIRSAISAIARGDMEELETLKDCCPKSSYLVTDPDYSDGIQRLFAMAVTVESTLQKLALDFFVASRLEIHEVVNASFAEAAALEAAWRELISDLNISHRDMSEAGPPRHQAVQTILRLAKGEENPETVQLCLESMRAYIAA